MQSCPQEIGQLGCFSLDVQYSNNGEVIVVDKKVDLGVSV